MDQVNDLKLGLEFMLYLAVGIGAIWLVIAVAMGLFDLKRFATGWWRIRTGCSLDIWEILGQKMLLGKVTSDYRQCRIIDVNRMPVTYWLHYNSQARKVWLFGT